MSKLQSRTFAFNLGNDEVAIVSITTTGHIDSFPDNRIKVLDPHGYLVADLRLAMDVTQRIISETHRAAFHPLTD